MSHTVGNTTHAGKVRDTNQDSFAVLRRKDLDNALDGVFIVADGMGGAGGKSGGEVASRTVVETLTDGLVEWAYERGSATPNPDLNPLLSEIIERANNRVWMKQIERRELSGMGTTCLVGTLKGNQLTLAHAGDSRVYLLRKGKLSQLTQDHSTVWQEVLAGKMTREEAATSKFRNQVTKAIGLQQHDVDAEVQNYDLDEGDTLLFCTDGLTTEVSDSEIARILASVPPAQDASDRLVDAALKHGGSDNITVVVVRYGVFQPLSAASVMETPVRTPKTSLPEIDELTDPTAEWRKPKNGSKRPSKPAPVREAVSAEEVEDDIDETDEPTPRRKRNRNAPDETAKGGSNLLIALAVVLLMICIAEGIVMAIALKNRTVAMPKTPSASSSGSTGETYALDEKPVMYAGIKMIYADKKNPLREDFLESDGISGVYVVTASGKFLHVDDTGSMTPAPKTLVVPLAPKPDPKHVYTRFDMYGNTYQTYAKDGAIQKFNIAGTRVNADITGGTMLSPQAFAFDKDRNLFVLNEKKLYYIPAVPYRKMGETQNETAPLSTP